MQIISEEPQKIYRKGFSGIILQAAGFVGNKYKKYSSKIAIAATFGATDFNLYESQKLRRRLNHKTPFYIQAFKGGHNWAPSDCFGRAVEWIEEEVFIKPKTNF